MKQFVFAMREAVVVSISRTGLAKSYRGSLRATRPEDLAAHCIKDILRKTPLLEWREVEDVILGAAFCYGPPGTNIARQALLAAGLPASIPGVTVNRLCSSGLDAIAMAAHAIVNEGAEAAIGGGVESFSFMPEEQDPHRELAHAEILAQRYRISRRTQDEYALISRQRTARAQKDGFFNDEIAPFEGAVAQDEFPPEETSLEELLSLEPLFEQPEAGVKGTITAGNSAPLADGAAAALLMSRERADKLGIPYRLIFRAFLAAGCEPEDVGLGPVFAVPKLLRRYGLSVDDIDLWEINEAFAAQIVYCRDQLSLPMEKLNVNGGALSLGHPFGMTGARLTATLANEMSRRPGSRFGVVAMSVNGGQGVAGLFEAVHLGRHALPR